MNLCDAENRIVSVDGGASGQYWYDHRNWRVKKASGGFTTNYVSEGAQVLAEHNGATGGVLVDYIYAGRKMIAKEQPGIATRYFISDRLSVRVVVAGGTSIAGLQTHLPFGEEIGLVGEQEKHRFTSYDREGETAGDYAVTVRLWLPEPKPTKAEHTALFYVGWVSTSLSPINPGLSPDQIR